MITIDGTKILSVLGVIGKALIVFLVCRLAVKLIMQFFDKLFERSKLESGVISFLKSALNIGLWVLTIIFVLENLGINPSSLVALLSVVTLAISLSLQNILTDMFSGINLLIAKPFVVGDYVDIAGTVGTVKEITIMRTMLDTVDNRVVQIPNSDVAAARITNYSAEPLRRVDLTFSASYDAPTDLVKQALLEAIHADPRIKADPAPFVALNQYRDNDIEYLTRSWVDNSDYWGVYFDLNERVREVFAQYGIAFSYPHTVVHITDENTDRETT